MTTSVVYSHMHVNIPHVSWDFCSTLLDRDLITQSDTGIHITCIPNSLTQRIVETTVQTCWRLQKQRQAQHLKLRQSRCSQPHLWCALVWDNQQANVHSPREAYTDRMTHGDCYPGAVKFQDLGFHSLAKKFQDFSRTPETFFQDSVIAQQLLFYLPYKSYS